MKRIIAATLTLLMMFFIFGCADSTTPSVNSPEGTIQSAPTIAEELLGKWYGPYSDPVLDINADGTGTAEYQGKSYAATFTAAEGIFTVSSEGYSISGDYTLENEILTVLFNYSNEEYTLIFTRNPVTLPSESYIYTIEETVYEITPQDGTIILVNFPPEDNPRTKRVYFFHYSDSEEILHIYPHPPEDYGKVDTTVTSTAPSAPSDNEPEIPVPETLDITQSDPKVTLGGETLTLSPSSGDDIVGTWTNTNMDTTISIFGVTNTTTTPITYTFNADGTGSVLAMGIFPGTLTYTCENGRLSLTVTMFGETESGTGYVMRVGDTLYVRNHKDETLVLTRQG